MIFMTIGQILEFHQEEGISLWTTPY